MSSPRHQPDRRRKATHGPAATDPEAFLSEELELLPLSLHLEDQVQKLRNLERALHKAGKPAHGDRRPDDKSDIPMAGGKAFNLGQRDKYLVPIKTPLKLQAGELCYLRSAAEWQSISEIKVSPARLPDPALPSKHLSIRRKGETPDRPSPLTGKPVVSGYFYLTNRRIIMSCKNKRRLSINLRSAYRRTVYRNAIDIQHMDSRLGRSYCDTFYLPEGDIELADSLLQCFG